MQDSVPALGDTPRLTWPADVSRVIYVSLVDLHVPTSHRRLGLNPDLWRLVATQQAKRRAAIDLCHCATRAGICMAVVLTYVCLYTTARLLCSTLYAAQYRDLSFCVGPGNYRIDSIHFLAGWRKM